MNERELWSGDIDPQNDRDEMPTAFHERVGLLNHQSYCGFKIASLEEEHDGVRVHVKNHKDHELTAWGSDQVEAFKKVIDRIDEYQSRHP